MNAKKKTVVNWNKISFPHKLSLLRQAGYDLRRVNQDFINNFGGFMLEAAERSPAGIAGKVRRTTAPTRKKMPPGRNARRRRNY